MILWWQHHAGGVIPPTLSVCFIYTSMENTMSAEIIDINPFLKSRTYRKHAAPVQPDPALSTHVLPRDKPEVYVDWLEIADEMDIEIEFLVCGGYLPAHILTDIGNVMSALAVARASVTEHVRVILS